MSPSSSGVPKRTGPGRRGGANVRLVPHAEIASNGWDLNVGRYVKTAVSDESTCRPRWRYHEPKPTSPPNRALFNDSKQQASPTWARATMSDEWAERNSQRSRRANQWMGSLHPGSTYWTTRATLVYALEGVDAEFSEDHADPGRNGEEPTRIAETGDGFVLMSVVSDTNFADRSPTGGDAVIRGGKARR